MYLAYQTPINDNRLHTYKLNKQAKRINIQNNCILKKKDTKKNIYIAQNLLHQSLIFLLILTNNR